MSLPVKKEPGVKKEPSEGLSPALSGSQSDLNKSASKDQGWQDIPLKCCTKEELKDIRYHMMKFQSKQDVDIIKNFTKPVRLHRKDPRNIQFHLTREEIDRRKKEQGDVKSEPLVIDEDGEEREDKVDMSQVAPDGGARKHRRNLFKRKTKQVNLMDENKRKLRYEEYYPWVIEDYNGKNVFVGNYEAGSSETQHVLFVFDKDGFKMVPAEKVYRFTPRNKYATLTLEEAEAKMEKNSSAPRWLMKHLQDTARAEGTVDMRYTRPSGNGAPSESSATARSRKLRTVLGGAGSNDRDSDHDDIDFDEEFADDEEAPIMDGDEEENKLSERKIKREMLKASHFDGNADADADDDDINDLFETEKTRKVDKEGKKLKKVLNQTEGGVYESDDNEEEQPPYVSQSDLESPSESEDEELKVKAEEDGLLNLKRGRAFSAINLGNGFVKVIAPKQFLAQFPKGEWDPNPLKRQVSSDVSPNKKMKLEQDVNSPIKKDRFTASPSPLPAQSLGNVDLHFAGNNNELVTVEEVLGIVKNNPLTTKELLFHLKNRISSHKDNKQRIISIVKQTLKLVDGKLVLKE